MPENPYQPPKGEPEPGRPNHGLLGWSLVAAITLPTVGAVLGFAAFIALAFSLAAAGLAFRISIGNFGAWMLGGFIAGGLTALLAIIMQVRRMPIVKNP